MLQTAAAQTTCVRAVAATFQTMQGVRLPVCRCRGSARRTSCASTSAQSTCRRWCRVATRSSTRCVPAPVHPLLAVSLSTQAHLLQLTAPHRPVLLLSLCRQGLQAAPLLACQRALALPACSTFFRQEQGVMCGPATHARALTALLLSYVICMLVPICACSTFTALL